MTPDLRTEAAIRDAWLVERLDTIVPTIMEREGVDAWIVAGREYNEDPVLSTMLPATWLNARRRTILVFTDGGRSRAAVARYAVDDVFPSVWDPDDEPDQWRAVSQYLEEADPENIAINAAEDSALADGLSASEHDLLIAALSPRLRERIQGAGDLAIAWLETRTPGEMAELRVACRVAHGILAEALSPAAIDPGVTSTEDLQWWLRERVRGMGLSVWFHPSVSVQRQGRDPRASFSSQPEPVVIDHGDLVHIDFGIVWLGLHTDQQQHGYVLRPGEHQAPEGLQEALRVGNRLQDILLGEFAEGRSGDEILRGALARASAAEIDARIYSHPIGLHGHAAGPAIGLWDRQDRVPGHGARRIHPDTAYSIELSATSPVAEWEGQPIAMMLEEEAVFDGSAMEWADGRQTALHLI